jgi:hypothetical protein
MGIETKQGRWNMTENRANENKLRALKQSNADLKKRLDEAIKVEAERQGREGEASGESKPEEQVAWLIEIFKPDNTSTGLAVGICGETFRGVAYDKALRFSRECDADAVKGYIGINHDACIGLSLKVVEHMWGDERVARCPKCGGCEIIETVISRINEPVVEQKTCDNCTSSMGRPRSCLQNGVECKNFSKWKGEGAEDERLAKAIGKYAHTLVQYTALQKQVLALKCINYGDRYSCMRCDVCKLQSEIKDREEFLSLKKRFDSMEEDEYGMVVICPSVGRGDEPEKKGGGR